MSYGAHGAGVYISMVHLSLTFTVGRHCK